MGASLRFGLIGVFGFFACWPAALAGVGSQTQYFPQVACGGGSVTQFAIHNPYNVATSVKLELRSSQGELFFESTVAIPPKGSQSISVGGSLPTLRTGWARLTSTGTIAGTEFFQLRLGTQVLPRIGLLPAPPVASARLFGFLDEVTNTGIALANPSSTEEATVQIRLVTNAGVLLLSGSTTLPPHTHLARFLNESPFFPGLHAFEGIIELEANRPIIAAMLRSDDTQLSAAAVMSVTLAGVEPGGITRDYLADGAVSSEKLADGAVTLAKMADGSVSFNQLHPDLAGSLGALAASVANLMEPSDQKTRLLFPLVNTTFGWQTQIAIANTGKDPSGTPGRTGTATVHFFGSGGPSGPSVLGPIEPGNTIGWGLPGDFFGYLVVICDFPFAHGVYAISYEGSLSPWGGEAQVLPSTRDPNRVEARGH